MFHRASVHRLTSDSSHSACEYEPRPGLRNIVAVTSAAPHSAAAVTTFGDDAHSATIAWNRNRHFAAALMSTAAAAAMLTAWVVSPPQLQVWDGPGNATAAAVDASPSCTAKAAHSAGITSMAAETGSVSWLRAIRSANARAAPGIHHNGCLGLSLGDSVGVVTEAAVPPLASAAHSASAALIETAAYSPRVAARVVAWPLRTRVMCAERGSWVGGATPAALQAASIAANQGLTLVQFRLNVSTC